MREIVDVAVQRYGTNMKEQDGVEMTEYSVKMKGGNGRVRVNMTIMSEDKAMLLDLMRIGERATIEISGLKQKTFTAVIAEFGAPEPLNEKPSDKEE
ncbi:MAG: hypothetical protein ACXQT3_02910 [Methermicoccaceae archaeon]